MCLDFFEQVSGSGDHNMFLTQILKDCPFTGFCKEGISLFCAKAGIVHMKMFL